MGLMIAMLGQVNIVWGTLDAIVRLLTVVWGN
jgi:hypothetical protein